MYTYKLVIITENQGRIEKGHKLAQLIITKLNADREYSICKYQKFPNSFKITIKGAVSYEYYISDSIKLTSLLGSPWLVSYFQIEKDIDLIFNKTEQSKYQELTFNLIRWASFTIIPSD